MENFLRFFAQAARLKSLKRAGWGRCGLEPCESVADHTFGVGLMALMLPEVAVASANRDRCVALALVHDLAESIVGDITPHDAIEPAEKHRREREAMGELSQALGDPELLTLWLEFEHGQTEEAKVVRELDVIEMAWQASHYRAEGSLSDTDASSFFASARARVRSNWGTRLLDAIEIEKELPGCS